MLRKRPFVLIVGMIAAVLIFAYGFQVTQVNLEELGSEARRQSLARIMRALARPDFLQFEEQETTVDAPIFVPCPEGVAPEPVTTTAEGGAALISPSCAAPGEVVTIEGQGFPIGSSGVLNFIPPSGVSLRLANIEAGALGGFTLDVEMRDRESQEPQLLRAITRQNVGWPTLSQNGRDTIAKIIETVFMALLATVIGTLLSIPVSFIAARNLMAPVKSPVVSVSLMFLLAPIGAWLGARLAALLTDSLDLATPNLPMLVGGLVVAPALAWLGARWAFPREAQEADDAPADLSARIMRLAGMAVAAIGALAFIYLLAQAAILLGLALEPRLGSFGFVGKFIADMGGIVVLTLPAVCGLIGLGIGAALAGRLGQSLVERLDAGTLKIVNVVAATAAGAALGFMLGRTYDWFYQPRTATVAWVLTGIGALIGLLIALRARAGASLPIGFWVYNVTRTVLNALRAVEALIMVIVFAVWVGIGPFAGVLALGLHTVAALAKLYSEQVESISTGPLEAVTATGANRLQMIVYAVIPQIVPPYISFTMYRWDINVRMSTIIGFAGGGGIGFLLQQNINLLNYRAASAQIIAIAVVVSLMDYFSSWARQKVV